MTSVQANDTAAQRPTLRPLPGRHDDLNAEIMTAALRAGGLADVHVSAIRRRPIGVGVGMMASIELVELDYDQGQGPASVVVKLPAVIDSNRAVAEAFDLYAREVLFYRDLAHLTPACTPKVFFADVVGSSEFMLVLEDLSDYRLGDQLVGCSVDDARLAMVELGKLHASFWDKVQDGSYDFIPLEIPSTHGTTLREAAGPTWDAMLQVFPGLVPDEINAQRDRFLAAIERMQRWMVSDPITVAHGDFRMDNIFYGQKPGHERVAAIDWQGTLRSKGIRDVGHLLSGSVNIEDRRAHERELVALWHRTLVEGGVTGYSAEQAWNDYLRTVLFQWTIVAVICGSLDASNERAHAWMSEYIKRSVATVADHDLFSLLPEFE